MVAAKECGIRIPEEISLVCFDDFTRRELMEPELTCIQQPIESDGKSGSKVYPAQYGTGERRLIGKALYALSAETGKFYQKKIEDSEMAKES